MMVLFILPIVSISEYCEDNARQNVNCTRYFEAKYKVSKLEIEYNTTIKFLNLNKELTSNLTQANYSCGIYLPETQSILISLNRTGCGSVNKTITHELKHLKCDRQDYHWRNNTEAHQGCFLNITL